MEGVGANRGGRVKWVENDLNTQLIHYEIVKE